MTSLDIDAQGEITVLDEALRRISVYEWRGDALEYVRQVGIPLFGRDHCVMDGDFFVLGMHEGHAIHRISKEGVERGSMHPIPSTFPFDVGPNWQPILAESAATGYIECRPALASVAFVSEWLPEIYVYSTDGILRSQTPVPGYVTAEPVVTDRGAMHWGRDQTKSHNVFGMTSHGSDLLVQIRFWGVDTNWPDAPIETFIVRGGGHIEGPLTNLPMISSTRGEVALAWTILPFPRVLGLRVHGSAP
jgi:hypothetical protein